MPTSKINAVRTGTNIYCGPAVLSIATGFSTDHCARLINKARGKSSYYEVTSCYMAELIQVLENEDYEVEVLKAEGSLYWNLSTIKQDGIYIVATKTHFVALEINGNNRFLCDNHTKTPIRAANSARLGQEVVQLTRVWKSVGKEILENQEAWGL